MRHAIFASTLVRPGFAAANLFVFLLGVCGVLMAQDVTLPQLVSATSATGSDITVRFSETMSLFGLNSTQNYQVSSGAGASVVSSVKLWPGNT